MVWTPVNGHVMEATGEAALHLARPINKLNKTFQWPLMDGPSDSFKGRIQESQSIIHPK